MSSEHLGRRRHAPFYVQLPLQSSLEDPCCGDQLVPLACGVVMQVLACQGGSPGTLRALCDTVCRQAGLGQFIYMCVYIFSSPHWIAVNTCDPDDTEGQHQAGSTGPSGCMRLEYLTAGPLQDTQAELAQHRGLLLNIYYVAGRQDGLTSMVHLYMARGAKQRGGSAG